MSIRVHVGAQNTWSGIAGQPLPLSWGVFLLFLPVCLTVLSTKAHCLIQSQLGSEGRMWNAQRTLVGQLCVKDLFLKLNHALLHVCPDSLIQNPTAEHEIHPAS